MKLLEDNSSISDNLRGSEVNQVAQTLLVL